MQPTINNLTAPPPIESVSTLTRRFIFPGYGCTLAETRSLRHEVNALLRAADLGHAFFHNHTAQGGYYYDYPAVQYRTVEYRGQSVAGLWGMGEKGLWALERFETALFSAAVPADTRWLNFSSDTRPSVVSMTPGPQPYLVKCFGLNQAQAQEWNSNPSRKHQDRLIQKYLRFALFGLLNALDFKVPDHRLNIRILDVPRGTWQQTPPLRRQPQHKTKGLVMALDVEFEANLSLPYRAGLGMHKAFGWGVVEQG